MEIENKLRKRIKTISITTGDYPKEIQITQEEYKELGLDKFEGVKLKVRSKDVL